MTCAYPSLADWGGKRPADPEITTAAQAEELAWSTMVTLSGGLLTLCPVTVRPTFDEIREYPTWLTSPVGTWPGASYEPYRLPEDAAIFYGVLGNQAKLTAVIALERPVGQIVEVKIDGTVVDPSAYRVDEGRLIRVDSGSWPTTNNMFAASGSVGVFEITYYRGFRANAGVTAAAGVLAWEFYKALTGAKTTRLPERVTAVTRQGVTYQLPTGLFDDGHTGIREVDVVLRRMNPNGVRQPTVVMSPDTIRRHPRTIGY